MNSKGTFEVIEDYLDKNQSYISNSFSKELNLIKKIYDIQYLLLQKYTLAMHIDPYVQKDRFTELVGTALFKNMLSIYSVYDLTYKGLIGSGRIILRNIFEFLIIGKYASITNNDDFITKWEEGRNISLKLDIFKNIDSPNSDEIKRYWDLLNKYVHSTVFSQQLELDSEKNNLDVKLNILFLLMLLDMNYHLINSHYANKSIKYYAATHEEWHLRESDGEMKISGLKREINTLLKMARDKMLKEPRKVIYDYKLTWKLKNLNR